MDVLKPGMLRGTSVDDYVDADGLRGGFQNVLAVYGKAGEPCPMLAADRENGHRAARNVVVQELFAVIRNKKYLR